MPLGELIRGILVATNHHSKMVPSFDQWEGTAGRRINDGKKKDIAFVFGEKEDSPWVAQDVKMWYCCWTILSFFWDVWVFSSDLTSSYKVPWCHNGTSWGRPGVSWTRVHHHLDWSLHVELLVDGWPSSSWKLFIGETHENYPRFSMGFSRGECPTKATKIGPYTFSKRKDNKMIWQLSRLAQFLFPISSWKFRVFQKIRMLSTNQITTHPSCFNFQYW